MNAERRSFFGSIFGGVIAWAMGFATSRVVQSAEVPKAVVDTFSFHLSPAVMATVIYCGQRYEIAADRFDTQMWPVLDEDGKTPIGTSSRITISGKVIEFGLAAYDGRRLDIHGNVIND